MLAPAERVEDDGVVGTARCLWPAFRSPACRRVIVRPLACRRPPAFRHRALPRRRRQLVQIRPAVGTDQTQPSRLLGLVLHDESVQVEIPFRDGRDDRVDLDHVDAHLGLGRDQMLGVGIPAPANHEDVAHVDGNAGAEHRVERTVVGKDGLGVAFAQVGGRLVGSPHVEHAHRLAVVAFDRVHEGRPEHRTRERVDVPVAQPFASAHDCTRKQRGSPEHARDDERRTTEGSSGVGGSNGPGGLGGLGRPGARAGASDGTA